ncbi:protein ZGRF1-like isoform X1 [Rhinatrema bivittatum]|uniref:protein ZGRF1-like isoform X1 n=1 Tax=Rhinatrema bivittatum TaxID=194408 RepID=UPI00112E4DCC|nr:protein ZGRF1-like isoform X1 [Rhinatrema bivittatum]
MSSEGNKAVLFDVQGKHLDCLFLKSHKVEPGDDLESDRFLITVEAEKFTEYSSHDKLEKKELPKTKRSGLKPFGHPRLQLSVGLKRKSTGFQGPREVPKKTADEVHAPAISPPAKRSYTSCSPSYTTSSLFSTVYRKDTEINLPATSSNILWRNTVAPDKKPGMLDPSLLSASSVGFPNEVGETEKYTHSITAKSTVEQLKCKGAVPYSAEDSPTPSGVTVSQNIRSRTKILALLKFNPTSVVEEKKSLGAAQCHPGDQLGENMNDLSEKCIDTDLCTSNVIEERENIQPKHPSNSISKSKWDIYLPQRPTDLPCETEKKHLEEFHCLHLGLQEPHSQDEIYIFGSQQLNEKGDGTNGDRSMEKNYEQSSWDQNAATLLSTLCRNDGAAYKSAGSEHAPKDKENKSQTSKFNEITNSLSLEGSNYSASSKELCVLQKTAQNGSTTHLTDSVKDPKVSPAAESLSCRLSPRTLSESRGNSIEGIVDDDIVSAGGAVKDILPVSGDFGDPLQDFVEITFNLLDNFDFGVSEEDKPQESSSLSPSSESLLKSTLVKNGVRSPEKMTSNQGENNLIKNMSLSANINVCKSINGEALLSDKISMDEERIVKDSSPESLLDFKPSESEHIIQRANAENFQITDDKKAFNLSQVSVLTNSLMMNEEHTSASEHKGMTLCEFNRKVDESREIEIFQNIKQIAPVTSSCLSPFSEMFLQSPEYIFSAPTNVSEKGTIVHKGVQSRDLSLSYRDPDITSDSPLLTVSLKNGDENCCALIKKKCCATTSSKLDNEVEDPCVSKTSIPSLGSKYLSEELEAYVNLSCNTIAVNGDKYENSEGNCQKRWVNADKSLALSRLVKDLSLLRSLTEHSTALESLEGLEMMRGENTDLLPEPSTAGDEDDPTREAEA